MSRHKGLLYCNEVKRILQNEGHKVDGPFFKLKFFGGKMNGVHEDIFGVGDLVSCINGKIILHQVTILGNKAHKIKEIEENEVYPIWIWCRIKKGRSVAYRVFCLPYTGLIEEGKVRWKASSAGDVGGTN